MHEQISSLWGLWIILAAAVTIAAAAGATEYALKLRQQHEDAEQMRERAAVFRSALPKAAAVGRATSAFWQTMDKSRRSSISRPRNSSAPGPLEDGMRAEGGRVGAEATGVPPSI